MGFRRWQRVLAVAFVLVNCAFASSSPVRRHPHKKHRSAKTAAAPVAVAAPQPPSLPPTPSQQPARPAVVTFASGSLTVKADNAGLNRTLREISRVAGIKLSGTVKEERVYGTYGPGTPATVLSELIDGTGANMLFVEGDAHTTPELILTQRDGGPSPPSPEKDEDAATPASIPPFQAHPLQQYGPQGPERPPAAPHSSPPDGSTGAGASTGSGQGSGNNSGSGANSGNGGNSSNPNGAPGNPNGNGQNPGDPNQPPPNGVKTPQQIYDELQRMRQGQPPQ